jgi:hypothetical protein
VVNPTFLFYGEKMKTKTKTKTKNLSIFLILSLTLLMGTSSQIVNAQIPDRYKNYDVYLSISPSHILDSDEPQQVGYVYFLNKNGVSIESPGDVEVLLTSDNPQIASVPEKIIFPTDAEFATFEITPGTSGVTTITAAVQDKIGFQEIRVGADESFLPDDLVLELNFPTNKMHIASEMPFTVFLRTSEGQIVRAPYDIDINLDYEKSLAVPNNDVLTIKAGDYYAWGTIETGEKIGTAFIRAIQDDIQLDTAKSIDISSTLPTALSLNIYPYLIPAEIDRNLDIFVSVLDSDGQPTVANEDIPLKFFSNNQDFIGEELDDAMEETKMVIKEGEFGFNFRLNVDLIGLISNDLMIGVSSAGYGTAIDQFQTVGESISVEDQRIQGAGALITSSKVVKATDTKTVQLFGPLKIPSNATAYFAYQMAVEEDDDNDGERGSCSEEDEIEEKWGLDEFKEVDLEEVLEQQEEDEEERREGQNMEDIGGVGDIDEESIDTDRGTSDTSSEDSEDLDVVIYCIDFLEEPNRYPLQAAEDYRSTGLVQYLDVISEDASLATVTDVGSIRPGYSYGVAKIDTTQKSGEFLLSANMKGIGSGAFRTEVVNTLEQKEIRAFSPTGKTITGPDDLSSILINRDGSFDIFLVALDGSERPKVLDSNKRYLITPSNGVLDIPKGSTYAMANLQSESFRLEDGTVVELKVQSIGEDADTALENVKEFKSQLSSQIQIEFPLEKLDVNKENHIGVVQLVDLQGNPIESFKDLKAKIISSDESIIEANVDAQIKKGMTFAQFPIETTDELGSSEISAAARGMIGTSSTIKTASSSSSLSVFTSGLVEPIPPNKPIQVTIYVDDDLAESVAGATVTITSLGNSTINNQPSHMVRTGPDGSATFELIALNGPEIDVKFEATADGYKDGQQTNSIVVDTPVGGLNQTDLELPQELVYVIIGGIVVVVIVVALFLKKSKENIEDEEEPWEDEDI